jgi:membrane protease YdiL (CAAX protease family)
VEDTGAAIPLQSKPAQADPKRAHAIPRWLAAIQALMVSGIPTQLLMAAILIYGLRISPFGPEGAEGGMSLEFTAMVLLFDTALTALLIRIFLEMSGEDSRTVFIGNRPLMGEVLRGFALVPVAFIGVTVVTLGLRTIAPWLHTVNESPLLKFMSTPTDAAVFLVVVVLGAGIKEELQRAFILHRFEHYLGGRRVGLAVFSGWFGILHFEQGLDVAASIGLLGLFWGVLYLKRRSAVMSMVNHASFNAAQVVQVMLVRALGA